MQLHNFKGNLRGGIFMQFQDFQNFAHIKGFSCTGQMAYGREGEYPVLLQYLSDDEWALTLTANILYPQALYSYLNTRCNKHTVRKLICRPDAVSCVLGFHRESPDELYQYFINTIAQYCTEAGIVPMTFCPFCGKDHCDALCIVQNRYAPVHEACAVHNYPPTVSSSTAETPSEGNIGMGILGALLGMLVGILPLFLCNLAFEFSFMPLYLLIPIVSALGFKFFRGPNSRSGKNIVTVFSVLGLFLAITMILIASCLREGLPINWLPTLLRFSLSNSELFTMLFIEIIYGLFLDILGIVLARRFVFRSNRLPSETFHHHLDTLQHL